MILIEKHKKYQHKYEYLTGEEKVPAGKQQMIEQGMFTYSPLGKIFDKQIKTIEDQGKKQIEALTNLKLKEIEPKELKEMKETKPNKYSDYFLNKLVKIRESIEPIDFNNLIYFYKGNSTLIKFIDYKGPMHIFKSIYNGDISLEDIEKEQRKFGRELARIRQGNPKNRSKEQEKIINDTTNLYNLRQEVVKMFNDYAKNMSRNIYESKHTGTGSTKDDDEDDNSNELINELKKLGVSTKNLIGYDSPIDLFKRLNNGDISLEEAEKEQDKFELLLDELNKID